MPSKVPAAFLCVFGSIFLVLTELRCNEINHVLARASLKELVASMRLKAVANNANPVKGEKVPTHVAASKEAHAKH